MKKILSAPLVAFLALAGWTERLMAAPPDDLIAGAGKVAGASTPRVLWKIVLPLIAAGILNSWIWIGMLSYREVTMALILYARNNVVISTVVWQFWGSGWIPQVSALGVILILFALIIVGSVRIALARVGEVGSAA